ncbi:hypothetical protein WDZ11_00065 (plasmid) [Roseomonas mucosa]|uniref:hypothetical protein n=1 Tax=Roseomonas mucosa TaxID=207340 RepID=UPI0030D22FF7
MSSTYILETEAGGALVASCTPEHMPAPLGTGLRVRPVREDEHLPPFVFSPAWRFGDDEVGVDLEVCRDLQRGRWRIAREARFSVIRQLRERAEDLADEAELARLTGLRAALRDVTTTDLSGATTAEAIAAVWPEILTAA